MVWKSGVTLEDLVAVIVKEEIEEYNYTAIVENIIEQYDFEDIVSFETKAICTDIITHSESNMRLKILASANILREEWKKNKLKNSTLSITEVVGIVFLVNGFFALLYKFIL